MCTTCYTGVDSEAGCFPNIEFNAGSSVEGCIYTLTPHELQIIDNHVGYPEVRCMQSHRLNGKIQILSNLLLTHHIQCTCTYKLLIDNYLKYQMAGNLCLYIMV